MRELQQQEIEMVSGGWAKSLTDALEGAIWGVGDGYMTGLAIGGINTKSGGLGFGVLAQLAGSIVGSIAGGIYGLIGGAIFGKDEIKSTIQDFRVNIK